MHRRVASVLAAPAFEDEAGARTARVLNSILWFIAAILALTLLLMPFTTSPLLGLAVVGGMWLLCLAGLVILRTGRVRLVTWAFLLCLWSAAAGLVATSGGIVNPEVAGFIVVVITAGLLKGARAAALFSGLSVLSALAIYVLDANGLLVTLLPITPYVGLIVVCVNVLLITALFHLALSNVDQALRQAGAYAHELEQERAMLEQRVAERTASAEAARQEAEAARQEAEVARRDAEAEKEKAQAINDLNDAMRGEQDVSELADNTLRYLCRSLDAQAGALFVAGGAHHGLDLAGTFAPAGQQALAAHYELGEGLVGQAALERRAFTLRDIPPGEMTIRSALGAHAPRHLLILPLLFEEQVIGVVELGTLSEFSTAQVDLLRRAAPNVAVAFHTAQTRMRVNELLIQTQQQAEELQAQEEELRAVNEELQAQAESLRAARRRRPGAGGEKER